MLSETIMDMTGATLLCQRLCNGEAWLEMTIYGDNKKQASTEQSSTIYRVTGGIYVEEMTWK